MALVVLRCPRCRGQVKLEEHWDEGFCVFCGTKVGNDIIGIEASEYGPPAIVDRIVDATINEIVGKLADEDISEASDIQRIKESMQARFTKYGDRFRDSKARYAKELGRFCREAWYMPFEATKRTWEDLRSAVEDLEFGCAVCMAYGDFTEAYMQSIDKLSDILRMKWKSSRLNPNAPRIDREELTDMRNRMSVARSWLAFYNVRDDSEGVLDADAGVDQ